MEITTKKYLEDFLRYLYRMCDSGNDIHELQILEKEIADLFFKTRRYDILYTQDLDNYIAYEKKFLDSQPSYINEIFKIYLVIVENLFGIPGSSQNNYEEVIWSSLVRMTFEDYKNLKNIGKLFAQQFPYPIYRNVYLNLDENNFNRFKLDFEKSINCESIEDTSLDQNLFKKLQDDLETSLQWYNSFIQSNYFSIRNNFAFYDKNIKVYPLKSPQNLKDELMIKIVSYSGDNPIVNIYDKYLSFGIRLGNVEEILKDLVINDMLTKIQLSDENLFEKYFSRHHIHNELVEIFQRFASEETLFELAIYLMTISGYEIQIPVNSNFVLQAKKGQGEYLNYYFYLSKRFDNISVINNLGKYVFLTKPDDRLIKDLQHENILYLRDFIVVGLRDAVHYFVKDKLQYLKSIEEVDFIHTKLLMKLKECPLGRDGWSMFEDIGVKIFDYLFQDDFRHYSVEKQSVTGDKIFRRDYLVNNLPKKNPSFWSDIKNDLNANIIVVEFKNYSEPINSATLYDTSKYLLSSVSNLIIVFSRFGLDESATILQRKLYNERRLMILVLHEDELREMILEKALGIDVSYRLDNLKFELFKLI